MFRETVIAATKGIINFTLVESHPRFAIEEFKLAVDHREDFALSKVTMRRRFPLLSPKPADKVEIEPG